MFPTPKLSPRIITDPLSTDNISQLLPAFCPRTTKNFYVQAIAVSTLNGQATINGSSQALGNDVDTALLLKSRVLADCIIVGAATARAENYGGVTFTEAEQNERRNRGQSPIAPIAVITAHAQLDPTSRLFTDTPIPPIIITDPATADPSALARIADTGATTIMVANLDATSIIAELTALGFKHLSVEGGPQIYSQFLSNGLVDSLNLTIDPRVTAITSPLFPLSTTDCPSAINLELSQCGASTDGFVFLRYQIPKQ
ncbi:MAG: pyrimidine reductase family protein [Corynebacterium sp.]|uniref:pyrimidine reductase family protein n=1 Tax=Corynebacterium sp. TaxID=1720 RepID=UPI0026DAE28C|nr:pyrimidine reductase family protein [Corynebacterium sp.]MDO5099169.1 pyrimidine reductase family protein [Corynebacterium sp.]